MAINLVHNDHAINSLGPFPQTVTVTVTSAANGNVVVLALAVPTAGTLSSVALSNVALTLIKSQVSNGNYTIYLYYGIVSGTGGTSLTFTVTGASAGSPVSTQMAEFSGINTSSVLDGSGVGNSQAVQTGVTETTSTGSITTGNAADLVIAIMTADGVGTGFSASGSPSSSFTSINTTNSGGSFLIAAQLAYQIESSTGTYSTSQAFSGGFSQSFYCTSIIAALQAGTVVVTRRRCWISIS